MQRGKRRTLLILGAGAATVMLIVVAWLWILPPLVVDVTASTLARSVGRETNLPCDVVCECSKESPRAWTCSLSDPGFSGSVEYTVTVKGRCWNARLLGGQPAEGPVPVKPSGCVGTSDQLGFP
jgi:hypothetical protein